MKIFHLPDLGEGLAEAEIRAWHVKAGEVVQAGEPMVSVETAKAVVDVPVPWAGKIFRLHGQVGEVVKTGAPLVDFEEPVATAGQEKSEKGSVVGVLEEGSVLLNEAVTAAASSSTGNAVRIMPSVRALARELGVDLSKVRTRGANGQITAGDVMALVQGSREESVQKPEPLQGVRRSMAQLMSRSRHEVVPATLMDDADVTDAPADFTVFLLQAMVAGAQAEPALNATLESERELRVLHHSVHIGLAIDSPGGLFVPVIRQAEQQSAEMLRAAIRHFQAGVKDRSLTPAELQGATLMLSNFGTLAGRYACPVIVPPLVAILACGKMREAVVVREGKMAIRRMAPLSLTFDHRAVTGGEAARFLAAVMDFLSGSENTSA